MKNKCGKTRNLNKGEKPYEVWKSKDGTWTWNVLKKYLSEDKERTNYYSRWLCAVKSPSTYGTYDIGDVYAVEIKKHAVLVETYYD